jgi:hypothetical protein
LHLCDLRCRWIELPLVTTSVVLPLLCISRARTFRQGSRRLFVGAAAAFAVSAAYLLWLHSEYFPDRLLDRPSQPPHAAEPAPRSVSGGQ